MPALCLVPTPLAAARAARRLCDAQGGVLFGPAVSTLDRLVPGLLAAAGDRRAILTPLAERLVAVEAGSAAGGPLAGLAPDSGVAGALASALAELRRGEVPPDEARAAARQLDGPAGERLARLAEALAAYEDRLAALGALDEAGALRAAADAARRGASSAETASLDLLVLDGICELSPAGWELVAALVDRARRTRVHLPFFPDRPDVSAPVEPLLRRLEALHEVAARADVELVLPRLDGDGRAPRTAALLAALAGGGAPAALDGPGEVLAVAGAGEEGEARAAAGLLARWLDAGLPPDALAVISPAPRRSAPLLARACAELGVPFASGRGLPLGDVPVVRLVLEAVAAAGGLGRTAAERLLGSAWLAPQGVRDLPALLDRAGAVEGRISPVAALRRRASAVAAAPREREALARAADALAALEALLAPLARPAPAAVQAGHLAALVERAGIRRRAARGPREVAARDLAALARLGDAADAVVRALSLAGRASTPVGPAELCALLALAVEPLALPPPPEPAAGAVELHGLEEAPGLAVRGAVLLGCARGSFPPPAPPDALLRDPERIALAQRLRRAALPTSSGRRARTVHRAFTAAAAGREAVAFVWSAPGPAGGGPLAPLVADALAAIGAAPPVAPGAGPSLDAARTAREALRAAARLGDAGVAALAGSPLGARAADARARGEIERARLEAITGGRAAPFAGRVEAADALAAALPGEWAPTQLEAFARCPYRAFLQIAARLPDRAAPDLEIDPRDEGSLVHAALERFVRARMARRAWPPAGSAADLEEAGAAADAIFTRFEREGRVGDPAVWAARKEAVRGRLERMVHAEARDHDGLAPVAVEHRFGGGAPAPALALSAGGETVRLAGRVDRIDAAPDRLRVLDYKNARSGAAYADELGAEAIGETSFQIPAYLMAAARDFPGRSRLEATFSLVRKAERLEPLALDAGDPLLAAFGDGAPPDAPRPFAAAVVETVRRLRAGAFPIVSRRCDGCPHGAVCRAQGLAERGAEEAP